MVFGKDPPEPYFILLLFVMHGLTTISCLVDIFVSARPWKLSHFVYSALYGIGYVIFSLIYWMAGGIGPCIKNKETGELECFDYIYPILDWGGNPVLAIVVVLVLLVLMPVFHGFWILMYKLRLKIFNFTVDFRNVPV